MLIKNDAALTEIYLTLIQIHLKIINKYTGPDLGFKGAPELIEFCALSLHVLSPCGYKKIFKKKPRPPLPPSNLKYPLQLEGTKYSELFQISSKEPY